MKIAFVSQPIDRATPPDQSSIGICTCELAGKLAESNEVTLYEKKRKDQPSSEHWKSIEFRRIPIAPQQWTARTIHRLTLVKTSRKPCFASPFYYFDYAVKIARDIRRNRIDIVHIHNFSQFVPVIRAMNPSAKIVLHMHCDWLTQLNRRMIDKRLRKTDLVVGCSDYITGRISRTFPQYAHRCRTLYNGVDPETFTAPADALEGKSDDAARLLFLGRVSPEKGLHVLLEAFGRIVKRCPDAKLRVIGARSQAPMEFVVSLSEDAVTTRLSTFYQPGDTDRYQRYLDTLVSGTAFGDRVSFCDLVPHADVPGTYRKADIFIFPSVWNEPFGMPVIEAMSCQIPVVATCGGGVTEIVQDGKTGLLVERSDPDQLAGAIIKLLSDPSLRMALGRAGRQRVLERFTWNRIAADLTEYYRTLNGG